MFVKVFFSSFRKSARSGFAECGHDRDGPLAVEGRLLSGHEVSDQVAMSAGAGGVPGAAGRS